MCCLVILLLPTGATINAFVRKFLVSKETAVLHRCDSEIWKFLVSKETAVLHRYDSEIWKFAFIKRVDKVRITTVKDAENLRFEQIEELWMLLIFMRVWRSFAVGAYMVT